jgi:type I restriction enzyme, S subunit
MKENWQVKKLRDVCIIEKIPNKVKNLPYVGLEHIQSNTGLFTGSKNPQDVKSSTFYFTENHVLYGRLRPYLNKVMIPDFVGHCSTEIFPIRVNDELDRKFLFYWLLLDKTSKRIDATSTGARMPRANMNEVLEFEIPIPPISEQKRLVEILDGAIKSIDKTKQNTEKNIENKKGLFESYLNCVFNNPNEIWEKVKLGDVCEFHNGKAHEKVIDENGEYIVVNSKFISSDGTIYKKTNQLLFPLHKGEIAMVMSDVPNGKALAKCFLVDEDNKYTLNQRIGAIKSNYLIPKFLFYQLNRNKYFLDFDNGENQTNLRKNDILNCELSIPSLEEQKNIINKIDTFSEQTKILEEIYQQKLTNLDELKKSILQKAFNSEL